MGTARGMMTAVRFRIDTDMTQGVKRIAFIKGINGHHWVGDGFPVRNIFSYTDIARDLSPFLLLDYAGPVDFPPTTRRLGVGQHPHRGFETVTIVYEGGVSHRDSSGGGGTIGPGDVQWMTAGSGVIHEEYHSPDFSRTGGRFEVVQLWVNLPGKDKMTHPRYQAISARSIPEVALAGNAGRLRVIAGRYGETAGPARTFSPMNVWDLHFRTAQSVFMEVPEAHTAAIFVLRGGLRSGNQSVRPSELVVMERAGAAMAFEVSEDTRLLFLGGEPMNDPIVGHGPFVMTSHEEIQQAVDDFREGRFGQMVPLS